MVQYGYDPIRLRYHTVTVQYGLLSRFTWPDATAPCRLVSTSSSGLSPIQPTWYSAGTSVRQGSWWTSALWIYPCWLYRRGPPPLGGGGGRVGAHRSSSHTFWSDSLVSVARILIQVKKPVKGRNSPSNTHSSLTGTFGARMYRLHRCCSDTRNHTVHTDILSRYKMVERKIYNWTKRKSKTRKRRGRMLQRQIRGIRNRNRPHNQQIHYTKKWRRKHAKGIGIKRNTTDAI